MKKKIIVIGIILLVLICILFKLNKIRNYFILKDIKNKIEQYSSTTNFVVTTILDDSYFSEAYNKDDKYLIKHYHKNNIEYLNENNSLYNITQYTIKEDNKKVARVFTDTSKYMYVPVDNDLEYSNLALIVLENSKPIFDDLWRTANNSKIIHTEYNNKDCYLITFDTAPDSVVTDLAFYFEASTGLLLRKEYGTKYINNKYPIPAANYFSYKTNTVTDDDIKGPDYSNYELIGIK